MSAEHNLRNIWRDFEPNPHRIGTDHGNLYVRVFLPYSDLGWSNPQKIEANFDSIKKQEVPPGLFESDEDFYAKDENGNLMPGNITEDIYWAVHHMLPFERLMYIKQLALLTYSAEDEVNYYAKGPGFHQTRDNHSFLTARPLELMMRINNFPQSEVNNGIIAGMIHDIATPPFGDPTKEIDPGVLNEEVAVQKFLDKYDLAALERFGFDKEKVLAAIRNEGTLGKLLDIADKISYTSIDSFNYVGELDPEHRSIGALDSTIKPMKALVDNDPKWANIYQEVRIDKYDDEPFFTNAHRLSTFLELRALMYKALYLNPHCRGQDMLYKMLMQPLYSREPNPDYPFNSENLLYLTDDDANRIILKSWYFLDQKRHLSFQLGVLPDYTKVKNSKNVSRKIRELQKKGALVIGSETIRKFNPATNFRARDPKDGNIKPFSEIFPEKAAELDAMVDYCNQTVVYYWPESSDPQSQEVKLRPTIEQIIEDAKNRNDGKLPNYSLY